MADPTPQWDVQGLAFGLSIGLLGVLLFLGRTGGALRPVHLLGVIALAVGTAYLVEAVDRHWSAEESRSTDRDDVIELP